MEIKYPEYKHLIWNPSPRGRKYTFPNIPVANNNLISNNSIKQTIKQGLKSILFGNL